MQNWVLHFKIICCILSEVTGKRYPACEKHTVKYRFRFCGPDKNGGIKMKEKVILAYSGGLDTTTIIPWLKENFDYEVICVCVDCGQAEELDGLERYHIPDDVMQYIANNIKSNIRELEGSLNKLIALSNLEKKPIDIALAAEALKDMISPDNIREITPELIMDIVSEHFNVSIADLKGRKRNAEIVLPRQIIMYLCREMTDTPLKAVGALLGGKDHASISHGVKKIAADLETDEALSNTVSIIRKKLNPL